MAKRRITNDPLVKLARKQRHLRQTLANEGKFYIEDCFPWAIKAGCKRFDCPMRSLSLPPIADPKAYVLKCNPVGDLADYLITLQRSADLSA